MSGKADYDDGVDIPDPCLSPGKSGLDALFFDGSNIEAVYALVPKPNGEADKNLLIQPFWELVSLILPQLPIFQLKCTKTFNSRREEEARGKDTSTFGIVSVVRLPPHMCPSLTCPKSAAAVRLALGLWSSVVQSVGSRDALFVRLRRLESSNRSRLVDLTAIRGQRNYAHSSHDLSRRAHLWKSCEAHDL